MAKYECAFGPINGTIGELVFYSSGGQQLVRRRPSRTSKRHPNELAQQAKFSLVNSFLKALRDVIRYTFKPSEGRTARNTAFRSVYQHLKREDGNLEFDFENMQISQGSLYPVESPKVKLKKTKLIFGWVDNSRADQSNATDKCILVTYCPALMQSKYKLAGATRKAGFDSLEADRFSGHAVETWIAFISDDMKEVSDSVYTGRFDIPIQEPENIRVTRRRLL